MSHDGHGTATTTADATEYATARETAPQSRYTTRDVAVGAVIALVGLLVGFGVPLLLA